LQSDPHLALYARLQDANVRAKEALCAGNMEALQELTQEQQKVLKKLRKLGLSKNPELRDIVSDVLRQMDEVMGLLQKNREQTLDEMGTTVQKKKQAAAYRAVEKIARHPGGRR
jgi:polyhydroxyalkanoate synthesis regulator phasin